jgi:aryl-alcohol dehydrogenase-like predicted oxidoreductase
MMEYRQLGASGLKVPVLALGTATFGGGSDFFRAWGSTQAGEATRLVDACLDAGVNLFDTANSYSQGLSEEILGQAIGSRRDQVLIATKGAFRSEPGPNGIGTSRHQLFRACEASLRRLKTDYIDLYQMHGFDAQTPMEETLRALDDLVRSGKVRYIGCSNHSGWHLMKALAVSERCGFSRYISHQAHYSLISREYEWELMPLALDQRLGTMVWSGLSGGRLSGKVKRGQPLPEGSRMTAISGGYPPSADDDRLFNVVDVLEELSRDTGRTVAQVALNWLLQRPSIATIVVGARNEAQLRENLGAAGWSLDADAVARLNAVSAVRPVYPYWHQRTTFEERNPPLW